jgi:nucleotide-binding universal stress UspA family protein
MTWLKKKSVVVPIDFSESSYRAVDVAREFVAPEGQLHLIYVVQPIYAAEPGVVFGAITDESRLAHSQEALEERFVANEGENITRHTMLGDPAHVIRDLAKDVSAELIVIPSHGRSGFKRFFLGSITEKVLRLAECPVLVLRSEETKET